MMDFTPNEVEIVENRLLRFDHLPPNDQWKKTEFFGVNIATLRYMQSMGWIESRRLTPSGVVQWRRRIDTK